MVSLQSENAKSEKDAEIKAIKAIPMVIFERFHTNIEVNHKAVWSKIPLLFAWQGDILLITIRGYKLW
jgi:hypothetical protein